MGATTGVNWICFTGIQKGSRRQFPVHFANLCRGQAYLHTNLTSRVTAPLDKASKRFHEVGR